MSKRPDNSPYLRLRWRSAFVLVLFAAAGLALVVRSIQLQVHQHERYDRLADARHLRVATISAHRGAITDRNGEPLAVSTPVDSIWAHPGALNQAPERLDELAHALGKDPEWLKRKVTRNSEREFIYLARHKTPAEAARILALELPGVDVQREYQRYYPSAEVAAHVLGFTNIDDVGQEGLELAYDHFLTGKPGAKRIQRDNLGQPVKDVESIRAASPGGTLVTSLDLGIQYIAYRELKTACKRHAAQSCSVVALDVNTGEVLAMANQPAYNPNNRSKVSADRFRNRAVTDILEPGSSIKPLVLAGALETDAYRPETVIDTAPGFMTVGPKVIEDTRNHGEISLTTVLTRSSNVGATKVALSLEAEHLWSVLNRFGLGQLTNSGFPGESSGLLNSYVHWRQISQATLAYGYGLSVTPLQLARAYAAIGAGGLSYPVTFVRRDNPMAPTRVLAPENARALIDMMETVVDDGGTGQRAAVPGYRVAGKTGTSWKFRSGGYSTDKYNAVFAGLIPASNPRLAIVVVIDEPKGDVYYGGDVAAPVFARVAAGAMRLMAVPPDGLFDLPEGRIVQARALSDDDTGDGAGDNIASREAP